MNGASRPLAEVLADEPRRCAWCRGPIPDQSATGRRIRTDVRTCSKACRQAAHRFRIGRADQVATRPMRLAYADPPYPGLARRYYGCQEVDHAALVERLVREYPDGWALSTSAEGLHRVLPLCPPATRVCVWVRRVRPNSRARRALSAWEPLLVHGGRAYPPGGVAEGLRDGLLWGGRQNSHPGALVGMKPAAFAEWMCRLLGAQAGDTLDDLFPGSGAIGRAWELYTSRPTSGDASPAGGRDSSLLQEPDASSPRGSDASRVDAGDVSLRDSRDASPTADRDKSRYAGAARRLAALLEEEGKAVRRAPPGGLSREVAR